MGTCRSKEWVMMHRTAEKLVPGVKPLLQRTMNQSRKRKVLSKKKTTKADLIATFYLNN